MFSLMRSLPLIVGVVGLAAARAVLGDGVTTAPAADTPAVHDVREALIRWNSLGASWTQAEYRRLYHTANPREAALADFQARDDYEQSKTQKLVRDKWGPAAEAKFAHLYQTDTIEDDQTAEIAVTGDRAVISWKDPDIEKTHLIKVDNRWMLDMHPTFEQDSAADPNPKEDDVKIEAMMKQAAADITAGKFVKADGFLDFSPRYEALIDDDND